MRNKDLRGGNVGFLAPMYLFTVVFLIGPFVYMILLSFLTRAETWGVVNSFTLRNYRRILEPLYFNTFVESVKLAVLTIPVTLRGRYNMLILTNSTAVVSSILESSVSVSSQFFSGQQFV